MEFTEPTEIDRLKGIIAEMGAKIHFGNYCEHCEPIYCCAGFSNECGCGGYPAEYKSTEKCGPYCGIKAQEIDLQLKRLLADFFVTNKYTATEQLQKFFEANYEYFLDESAHKHTGKRYKNKPEPPMEF